MRENRGEHRRRELARLPPERPRHALNVLPRLQHLRDSADRARGCLIALPNPIRPLADGVFDEGVELAHHVRLGVGFEIVGLRRFQALHGPEKPQQCGLEKLLVGAMTVHVSARNRPREGQVPQDQLGGRCILRPPPA